MTSQHIAHRKTELMWNSLWQVLRRRGRHFGALYCWREPWWQVVEWSLQLLSAHTYRVRLLSSQGNFEFVQWTGHRLTWQEVWKYNSPPSALSLLTLSRLLVLRHLKIRWHCQKSKIIKVTPTLNFPCLLHLAQYVFRAFGTFTIFTSAAPCV